MSRYNIPIQVTLITGHLPLEAKSPIDAQIQAKKRTPPAMDLDALLKYLQDPELPTPEIKVGYGKAVKVG